MEIKKYVLTVAIPDGVFTALDEMGIQSAAKMYSRQDLSIEVKDVTEFGAMVSGRDGKTEANL